MELEETSPKMSYRFYIMIWLALVILTGATVSLAGMGLGQLSILSALLIAATKSALVLAYFMRLKSERLTIFKVIIPLVMAVFLVFMILTFFDVAFRGGVK